MLLSVVVPVYCVEKTLDRCIKSIVNQSYPHLEVILVDDGSPDRCPQMCDEWEKRDPRIHVVHIANGGLSNARNIGIEQAQGEYITFVDSDDYIEQDTYQPLMEHLSTNTDVDILEYPLWNKGREGQKVLTFKTAQYNDMTSYWLQAYGYEHAYACNKIFKRKLFDNQKYAVGRVFEDVDIMPRLLRKCSRVDTTDKGLYHYCTNSESITSTATGRELNMLLESNLTIMKDPVMLHDSRYYMYVLNIQMDVFEQAGIEPKLPFIRINPLSRNLSTVKVRIKALLLNLLGIKAICILNKTIHKLFNNRSLALS